MTRLKSILSGSALALVVSANAQAAPCVNILHDEVDASGPIGSLNAIYLANLMGHWPHYEVRVAPIATYRTGMVDDCKATFYLGASSESSLPESFLTDFFLTPNSVAWIGYGQGALDQDGFAETFGHGVGGSLAVEYGNGEFPEFYEYVSYKGSLFTRYSASADGEWTVNSPAMQFVPAEGQADVAQASTLSELVHNATGERKPYVLRRDNRFVVGDVPFSYMHEGDRYFVFADLMFDILGEVPRHEQKLAFVRIEDIHAFYDLDLLNSTFAALRSEDVPISIAHIPLFADPFDVFGLGPIEEPIPSDSIDEFARLLKSVDKDPRNAIIWHGSTHQFGATLNPIGASGVDYEFWNTVDDVPIDGDSVEFTVERLAMALPVFDAFGVKPRYWVTPHYQGSAVNNRVFGAAFPWTIGRVTYYPTAFGPAFNLAATTPEAALEIPSVSRESLDAIKEQDWTRSAVESRNGQGQIFPFEIYRDVYGQRIVPETLGYMEMSASPGRSFSRDVAQILADAQRNRVIRDYWASFFFHPLVFNAADHGGGGRFAGDTTRLRELLIGLKGMGYRFIGLPEFEASLTPNLGN